MSKEQEPPAQPQRSNRDTKILDWLEQNMTSKLTQRGDDNQFQVKLNDSPPWEWSQRSPTIRGAVLAALENKDQFGTAQPQPRKEIKTGGTMRRVCSVCKAEFLGTGMDNLCSKHQPKRSGYSPNEFHKTTSEPASGEVISHEEMDRIEREHPPAAQPQCSDDIQRPQPDARVEKALRDYDEVRSLDKLPASGAASGEHKTAICPFCHGSFVVDATHIMELQQGAASGTPTSCSPGRVAGSEPQEPWRYVAIGLRGKDWQVFRGKYHHVGKAASEEDAKFFCMELNAALAAERADYDKLHDKAVHWQDEALAEREKREQAERVAQVCYDLHAALGVKWGDDPYAAINKLKSELLQALATIKHHNATLRVGSCHYIDVNLSALHEHDNKVRKPLVADKERLDWLEHRPSQVKEIFKDWECWPHNVRGAIDAALAQAKENRRDSAT